MSAGIDAALLRLQRQIEQFYALERTPDVVDFVRIGDADSRETLLVRESDDEVEIALCLPPDVASDDGFLQLVEGVSHFVYLAERARTNLPATRLELEMQAEVDKFVVLATTRGELTRREVHHLHDKLYARVRFLHAADTEDGERYRLANDLAARFVLRLFDRDEIDLPRHALRRFYRSGQTDKIHLARAA